MGISQPYDVDIQTSQLSMFLLSVTVVLPLVLAGMKQAVSSIALPQMNLDVNSASWYASAPMFAAPIGTILQSYLIDIFGRKTALISGIIPHIVGWSLMYWDRSFAITLTGRILTGLPSDVMFYASQVYIVECITVNNYRHLGNYFRTWPGIFFAFGSLLIFVLGTIFDYRQISIIAAVLGCVLFGIIYLTVPESPVWLYKQGRKGDAEISERKLRIAQPILQSSRSGLIVLPESSDERLSFTANCKKRFSILKRSDVYKPLLSMTIWAFLLSMTGGLLMVPYMVNIINSTPPGLSINATNFTDSLPVNTSTNETYTYTVVSGILIFFAKIANCVLLRYGMKRITIWSGIIVAVGMILMAFYNDSTSNMYILHVIGVWLVTFFFSMGVFAAPIAVLSDLFPNDAKGLASCVPLQTMGITAAIITKMFPFLYAKYGNFLFYQFAIITVVYTMYVYIFIPETVNNSYEKIRENYVRV